MTKAVYDHVQMSNYSESLCSCQIWNVFHLAPNTPPLTTQIGLTGILQEAPTTTQILFLRNVCLNYS